MLAGVDSDVFTISIISSVVATAVALVIMRRTLQKGGDDKSVGLRREENKASATNLQSKLCV